MLRETTISKMHEMKMNVMAQAFEDQLINPDFNAMPFEDRFGLLIDSEWSNRKSNRLTRLIKNAGYEFNNACVEDINYREDSPYA